MTGSLNRWLVPTRPSGAFTCCVTLEHWQGLHARVHARQYFPTPSHTNLTVALALGWLRPWMLQKTFHLKVVEWSEWPWLLSGCVIVEVDVSPGNMYPLQPKRRAIFQDVLRLRILILGTRKSLLIKR